VDFYCIIILLKHGGKIMTFEKIRELIVEQLGVEESAVTLETSLMKDLEADSLDAVEIIMAIEDEFEIEVPDEEAEKFQNVGDIVKYVDEKIN
jgi:acyl carrier protein